MRLVTISLTALSLLAVPVVASAQNNAKNRDCPPGLVGERCIPPGQAKKMLNNRAERVEERRENIEHPIARRLIVGQRWDGDYTPIRDYDRYDLPRPGAGIDYWRVGENVLQVNPGTGEILQIIALASLLD